MLRSVSIGAKRLLGVGFAALVATLWVYTPTYAANTQVNSTICSGNSSNASLIIDSPETDSVTNQLPLVITGTVESITQIDIEIDGQYNGTVPIATNQTTFTTSLQLTQGTHTIDLVGNDVCQFQDPTASLVVSYEPQVTPSEGGGTPTVTPGTTSNPQDPSFTPSEPLVPETGGLADVPIIGNIVPIMNNIARSLDLDATARQDGMFTAMMRFSLFTVGIGLAVFGPLLIQFIQKRMMEEALVREYIEGNRRPLQDPELKDHMRRNKFIAQGAGTLCLCLSFLI